MCAPPPCYMCMCIHCARCLCRYPAGRWRVFRALTRPLLSFGSPATFDCCFHRMKSHPAVLSSPSPLMIPCHSHLLCAFLHPLTRCWTPRACFTHSLLLPTRKSISYYRQKLPTSGYRTCVPPCCLHLVLCVIWSPIPPGLACPGHNCWCLSWMFSLPLLMFSPDWILLYRFWLLTCGHHLIVVVLSFALLVAGGCMCRVHPAILHQRGW